MHCRFLYKPIVVVSIFFSLTFSESGNPEMFLCIDNSESSHHTPGTGTEKLVYGYINGKKTACMSEFELRVAYSKAHTDTVKKSPEKKLQHDAVYRGEKKLANADLRGFDLKDIDLSGADLTNAHLESADLRGANLKNAVLTGANLENAYCKNADLQDADLTSANLCGAFFHHANLNNARGLTLETLATVATLFEADMEHVLKETIRSKYAGKLKNPKGNWNRVEFPRETETSASDLADPSTFK